MIIWNSSKLFPHIHGYLFIFANILKCTSYTGCPKKHGNSVTNSISSLLWISIVIPDSKSHNIIMCARIYFTKRVKDFKGVSIMSLQDEQWRRTSLLCLYQARNQDFSRGGAKKREIFFFFKQCLVCFYGGIWFFFITLSMYAIKTLFNKCI